MEEENILSFSVSLLQSRYLVNATPKPSTTCNSLLKVVERFVQPGILVSLNNELVRSRYAYRKENKTRNLKTLRWKEGINFDEAMMHSVIIEGLKIGLSVLKVIFTRRWNRSRKRPYDLEKTENRLHKQNHKFGGIGSQKNQNVSISSDFVYDSVAYDIVKTVLYCRSRNQKRNKQP